VVRQQPDAGEPAISPDGQHLYYSKDVTPGSTFEYNKDPNSVIFAILRRDLRSGQERSFVDRPGGSVAPRPSPDGRYLAFIRRVRLNSQLFLKDLQTGAEWPIFDNIDKDLQEAWTVHGVYPQYAWTPDSRRIVIWGQGKIWNVDVAAASGTDIPFTAHVDQTITPAVRFDVPVHQDEFPVRMLRDARVSPDGSAVAFSALGQLYVRELTAAGPAAGDPARLIPGDEPASRWDASFELDPAWSPDGRRVAYTTWNDRELGQVRVLDRTSGTSRALTERAGAHARRRVRLVVG
jgi:dipeptidyl aminopeptidase/acylaminoacyl peptidase